MWESDTRLTCLKHRDSVEKSWKLLMSAICSCSLTLCCLSAWPWEHPKVQLASVYTTHSNPHISSSGCSHDFLNHMHQPLHISLDACKGHLTWWWCSVQFSSVAQSCPTLCDPMNRSTPGLPVHHQLLEFTQTHVHRVSDAIQPSHPLSSPSPPAPNSSQHQGLFQWVNSSCEVAKVLEFQLQHQSFQWTPRTDLL